MAELEGMWLEVAAGSAAEAGGHPAADANGVEDEQVWEEWESGYWVGTGLEARGQMEGLMERQEWQWLLQQRLRLVLEMWQQRLCYNSCWYRGCACWGWACS